ncbi:hypothetical protein SAMN04488124_0450 [Halogeometricum limi]|uniref:Uncharacterized protein n=1 Tax=Halogeometricum limi TaxID=555875 RepID=A0A1I6FX34_9EURY|nr:hypothetical protein SAMN04488124_0450 [Halogeometricum limi]
MVNKVSYIPKLKTVPCGSLPPEFGRFHGPEFGHQRTYSLGVPIAP